MINSECWVDFSSTYWSSSCDCCLLVSSYLRYWLSFMWYFLFYL